MEKKLERLLRQINQAYYLVFTATIISAFAGYIIAQSQQATVDTTNPLSITLSSVLIIYMLISIPASLSFFYRYSRKLRLMEDENIKFKKYQNAAVLRLIAVGFGLVASVIVFFVLRNQSIIFCFAISAIGLFFCKPTISKIASDLDISIEEE
jgi:hypothetical protein